ncbi:MAG: bifunctional folylpolyglutamate synthase/dihydrofolate synthase [Chloroflexi bacterium]|nr:bifunctional folylpolyglutamate synthase/dihydrofolate synthase [Chloroflexota bacterium]
MDYSAAIEYLLSFTDYERLPGQAYAEANFDLRRVEALLAKLGNPHLGPRTVHIAGTKGKGSTAAMIASALQAAGHRVGLYTSPHLLDIRERFQVDGQLIHQNELAALVAQLKPKVEAVNREASFGLLTTFELLTALAFLHFARQRVDYQVLEVGLGGRLDATNVVVPSVCVITSLSLDHTAVLGPTLAHIAQEKAGIIKPGVVVVIAPQREGARAVLRAVCRDKGARLVEVGQDITWEVLSRQEEGQALVVGGRQGRYKLWLPLLGDHQAENAAVAVAALEALEVDALSIVAGLAGVSWPGRLQILRRSPWLVVDGAHNPYSAAKLAQALRHYFDYQRLILVMGASSDKDIAGMAEALAPQASLVLATSSGHPRASDPKEIVLQFLNRGVEARVASGLESALRQAQAYAGPRDLICVTGSLFLVAEALELARTAVPRLQVPVAASLREG